ncbi:MAG TPA: LacI family DNA-binding transcriptional regulator [Chthonomonadaceae bacterium]|nr:LacI family DNA-binding transcriptional regulator [Chthonomonadaceae bacterium]
MGKGEKTEPAVSSHTAHPTISTIASHMGLSKATVTHVLNGRATEQRISLETQQRVLKVAHDLGYRANAAARAVRAGRFGNIALIQSLRGQYLPNELLHGLTQAIAAKDVRFVLTQVPDVVIDEETYLPHTMRELSVDGVLINRHVRFSPPYLDRIHRLRIPAVFLNVKQEFDCVHPDDLMGGRMAAEYLLQLGHERIAYIDTEEPNNQHYSKHDRREGYEQAMRAAGKTPQVFLLPKEWQVPGQPGKDQRIEAARLLLEPESRPTAIVAYELTEAMAVVYAAHHLGLRIPQDLSLIHFHHWLDDRFFIPIQTVTNAMVEVGKEAVEMLFDKIANPQTALQARVVPVEMMEGATCMPPSTKR